MKAYFKKHLIVVITLVFSIIASIVINFIEDVSLIDNLMVSLLVLLITTFIFDFNKVLDSVFKKMKVFENKLKPSSVRDFDSVDKCAKEVDIMLKDGQHTVDFVSLDAKIRTQIKSKHRPMVELLNKFVSNEKIKLRYITTINPKNYKTILNFIISSKSGQKESYYAICKSTVPFASFYIIDKHYLVIRTPYNETVDKHYCIIEDESICALFISWFEMIWQNSKVIDSSETLINIYNDLKAEFDNNEKEKIIALTEKACSFFE